MGNTLKQLPNWWLQRDHPHIHGEYEWLIGSGVHSAGSPPYTWGIRIEEEEYDNERRITPIYMGNTKRLSADSR